MLSALHLSFLLFFCDSHIPAPPPSPSFRTVPGNFIGRFLLCLGHFVALGRRSVPGSASDPISGPTILHRQPPQARRAQVSESRCIPAGRGTAACLSSAIYKQGQEDECALSTYYVPGSVLSVFCIQTHLVFTLSAGHWHPPSPHCTDVDTEAQWGRETHPRLLCR